MSHLEQQQPHVSETLFLPETNEENPQATSRSSSKEKPPKAATPASFERSDAAVSSNAPVRNEVETLRSRSKDKSEKSKTTREKSKDEIGSQSSNSKSCMRQCQRCAYLKKAVPSHPGKAGGNMFADRERAKEEIREGMGKREYNVADFYHENGCAQAIATNNRFAVVTLSVITVNSIWIGIEMDMNQEDNLLDAKWYFQIPEYFFCVFFLFEWGCRFCAFRRKCDGLRDYWFCFDAVLVMIMVIETIILPFVFERKSDTASTGGTRLAQNVSNVGGSSGGSSASEKSGSEVGQLSILRMLRLLRLTRMVRFMRAMPELVTLIRSMNIAARPVLSTLGLLFIIIYMFAIVFKSQLKPKGKALTFRFGMLSNSMFTLLMDGTFLDDVSRCSNYLLAESPLMTFVFIVFILLSSFTVLNLLIGMLCEVVNVVSVIEKEKATVAWVKSKLMHVLEELDEDGSGMISKDEFDKLLQVPAAVDAMEELGVDVQNLVSLSDHLFAAEDMSKKKSKTHEAHEDDQYDVTVLARHQLINDMPPEAAADWMQQDPQAPKKHSAAYIDDDDSEEEGEEAELSFGDFIEMVIRLRSDNHLSIMDITDLRKLLITSQHTMHDNMDDLTEQGGKLVEELQQSVCHHPFYKLLCDHPEIKKSHMSPSRSHSRVSRIGGEKPEDITHQLRKRLDAAYEFRRMAQMARIAPDDSALERAVCMADAVEVMNDVLEDVLELPNNVDAGGFDVPNASQDLNTALRGMQPLNGHGGREAQRQENRRRPYSADAEAYDVLLLSSPRRSSPLGSPASSSSSNRPDILALARAMTTAAASSLVEEFEGRPSTPTSTLLQYEERPATPSSSPLPSPGRPGHLQLVRVPQTDILHLPPSLTPPPVSSSPSDSPSMRLTAFGIDSGMPLRAPSDASLPSRAPSRRVSPSPSRPVSPAGTSREDSVLVMPDIRRALTSACCTEETLSAVVVSDDTLSAIVPGPPAPPAPDEEALQRAFDLASVEELGVDDAFLNELGLGVD